VDENKLDETAKQYLAEVKSWDYYATPTSKATTIFQTWWDSLEVKIWKDEFSRVKNKVAYPDEQTLLELLLKDSAMKFVDDIHTSDTESVQLQITNALLAATNELSRQPERLEWWKHKNPSILHLLKTAFLPFGRQGLEVGGWSNTINAITTSHGPSWRMIVHLTKDVEAYGIYPGGQNGNPGSRFYDNFINDWSKGSYYRLWMMKAGETNDKRIIQKLTFTN
jgi:penicillin amidase